MKSEQAIELARLAEAPHMEIWPHGMAAFSLAVLGDTERAILHANAMVDLGGKLRNRGFLAWALWKNGKIAHSRGEWYTAQDFYQRGLELAPKWFQLLCSQALLEFEIGNRERGSLYLEQCLEAIEATLGYQPCVLW